MTGLAHQRLTQVVGYADGVLDVVTPALLSMPTPCRAWSLGMLLDHLGESLAALCEGASAHVVTVFAPVPARPADACPADTGATDDGASALVGTVRQRAAALLRAAAESETDAPVGVGGYPMPLDCLLAVGALEIAVHAWDVSQACGQRRPIPDELAADLLAQARVLVPGRDRAPLFAAPVAVSAHGTPSDQLSAYLGRVSAG